MFTSVICSTNPSKNKYVLKYNNKLEDFLCKFNRLVEGRIEYIEVNNNRRRLSRTTLLCNLLTSAMFAKSITMKNLKFINICKEGDDILSSPVNECEVSDRELTNSSAIASLQDETSPSTQHVIDLTKNSEKDAEIHQLFRK